MFLYLVAFLPVSRVGPPGLLRVVNLVVRLIRLETVDIVEVYEDIVELPAFVLNEKMLTQKPLIPNKRSNDISLSAWQTMIQLSIVQ